MKAVVTVLVAFFLSSAAHAQDFLPANLLMMENLFTHHVLLVEKSTHTLFVYENENGIPKLVQRFKIASGKRRGDKTNEGDRKTPEGIYTLREFYSAQFLKSTRGDMSKMYGAGAFTTDYPNIMDQRAGKGGSGIWLHSTDDATRIEKGLDSLGCVVVNDGDLKQISRFLDLEHTPIIIVQDVNYLARASWERNRDEIRRTVEEWGRAWQEKRFGDYISHYHQNNFKDRSKGGYGSYRSYKQAVFSRPDKPQIRLDAVSATVAQDYAVVTLRQDYRSAVINDAGKKTLYLQRNGDYDWKIVAELWERLPENEKLAFTPGPRYFKE
jgi:murein L,D-transpeptidase YafK